MISSANGDILHVLHALRASTDGTHLEHPYVVIHLHAILGTHDTSITLDLNSWEKSLETTKNMLSTEPDLYAALVQEYVRNIPMSEIQQGDLSRHMDILLAYAAILNLRYPFVPVVEIVRTVNRAAYYNSWTIVSPKNF